MSTSDDEYMEKSAARKRAYAALNPIEKGMLDACEKRIAAKLYKPARSGTTFEVLAAIAEYVATHEEVV